MSNIFTLRKNNQYFLLFLLLSSFISACTYYYSLLEKYPVKSEQVNINSNINDFKWRNRILVYNQQKFTSYDQYQSYLNDYKLLIFNIEDNYIYHKDIRILLDDFLKNSNLNINDFLNDIAILIGKDGKIKANYNQSFKLNDVFTKIDSMPMRRLRKK